MSLSVSVETKRWHTENSTVVGTVHIGWHLGSGGDYGLQGYAPGLQLSSNTDFQSLSLSVYSPVQLMGRIINGMYLKKYFFNTCKVL